MDNGWNQYVSPAPPGMGYDSPQSQLPPPPMYAYNCGMNQYQYQEQLKRETEEKSIKQTALCCTLSVLGGVGLGIYIGKKLKDRSSINNDINNSYIAW